MKTVHIEFVRSARGLRLWLLVTLIASIGLGGMATRTYSRALNTDAVLAKSAGLKRQTQALRFEAEKAASAAETDRHLTNLRAASKVLGADWNVVFSTVEHIDEPGVRLLNLNLEAGTQEVRLEYEVDSMLRVTQLTALLNSGYDLAPWKLEAVVRTAATPSSSGSETMRASWGTTLDGLR